MLSRSPRLIRSHVLPWATRCLSTQSSLFRNAPSLKRTQQHPPNLSPQQRYFTTQEEREEEVREAFHEVEEFKESYHLSMGFVIQDLIGPVPQNLSLPLGQLLIACVGGDDEIHPLEREWVIGAMCGLFAIDDESVLELESYEPPKPFFFKSFLDKNPGLRGNIERLTVFNAIEACYADGEFASGEVKAVRKVAKSLGVGKDFDKMRELMNVEMDHRRNLHEFLFPDGIPDSEERFVLREARRTLPSYNRAISYANKWIMGRAKGFYRHTTQEDTENVATLLFQIGDGEAERKWIIGYLTGMHGLHDEQVTFLKNFTPPVVNVREFLEENPSLGFSPRSLVYDGIRCAASSGNYSDDEKGRVRELASEVGVNAETIHELEKFAKMEQDVWVVRVYGMLSGTGLSDEWNMKSMPKQSAIDIDSYLFWNPDGNPEWN